MMPSSIGIFLARTSAPFMNQNKVGLFLLALFLFAMAGFLVGLSEKLKKVFLAIFFIFMVFPAVDVNFFVDTQYIGVTRGLYVTFADLFLLSLFIGTLLGASKHKLRFMPRGMLPFILFLAVGVLSLASARVHQLRGFEHPGYVYGLFETFNILKGLILFWVIMNFLRSEKEIKFVVYALVGIALLELAYVVYSHFILHDWSRAKGSLGHPNILSMFVGMFAPMLLVLALTYRRKGVMGYVFIIGFIGTFGTIVKTGSRAGIFTMAITCTIVSVLLLLNTKQINWTRVCLVGLLVLMGSGFLVVRYWDRMAQRFFQTSREATASTKSRDRLTDIGWEIAQKSIVFGHGINGFPLESATDPKYFDSNDVEHNLYLLQLAEAGIIGLVGMLILFFNFFRVGWGKVYRQKISMTYRLLSIGLMCGLLHAMVHSYFEFIFRATSINYVFWIIGATIMAMSYSLDRKKNTLIMLKRQTMLARMKKVSYSGIAPGGKHPSAKKMRNRG